MILDCVLKTQVPERGKITNSTLVVKKSRVNEKSKIYMIVEFEFN